MVYVRGAGNAKTATVSCKMSFLWRVTSLKVEYWLPVPG